jgi:hypothetical protein
MFTKGFVSQVIQNGASANPAVIADPITWSATLMAQHIVLCNAVFATIQLLIAAGLFYRPTAKAALAASIPWAIGVWWIGEGLSGMLAGTASPFMGAPGAVILYVFLALLAWPPAPAHPGSAPVPGSVATTGRLGRTLPRVMWAALWGCLAGFALQPVNRSPSGLATMLSGMKAGEPAWIGAMDGFGSRVLAHHGTEAAIVVAVLCALAATGVASGRLTRVAVIVAAVLGAVFWAAEDFGAIFTGQGTDPNSGLLLIVLAAAYWPAAAARLLPGRRNSDLEQPVSAPAPDVRGRRRRRFAALRSTTSRECRRAASRVATMTSVSKSLRLRQRTRA